MSDKPVRQKARTRLSVLVGLSAGVLLTLGSTPAEAVTDVDGDGVATGDCTPLDPSVGPLEPDLPDLAFTDTNCDGIDGDAALAVFVTPGGNDANPGTSPQPVQTLQRAVTLAVAGDGPVRPIYATAGTYNQRVVIGPNDDGVRIYGGYVAGTTWTRASSLATTVSGQPEALLVDGATDVVVQLVALQGSRGVGHSAYGIRAVNGAEVALEGSSVTAGPGGPGAGGANGSMPGKASNGAGGATPPNCDTPGAGGNQPQFGPGTDGGAGGVGGQETNDGENGAVGGWGGGIGGGPPGSGGVDTAGDTSSPGHGMPGQAGQPGTPGTMGAGGGSDLGMAGVTWTGRSGTDGANGGHGYGGGGGGGGAGNGAWHGWGTGGGGGQGGEGGTGGTRGTAGGFGGGSFGIYLWHSQVAVVDSTVVASDGGSGGRGGTGGLGGEGGDGGPGGAARSDCGMQAGNGGPGGKGGRGGAGGDAGGGSGGPSTAVFRGGSSVAVVTGVSELAHGAGGPGGIGAFPNGNGQAGQSGDVLGAGGAGTTDFDADGITDNADACVTVPRGSADANGDGCPDSPETTITSGPADGSFVLTTSARFGFTSTEAGSFTCSLDDAAGSVCDGPLALVALTQRTHLLRVWAQDTDGVPDPSAATRTWTVPRNNTTLLHGKGWAKKRGAGYYLGTFSETKSRGATLSSRASGVRKVALVASRGPGFGTVKVYLGTTLLKQVGLGSARLQKRQLIPVASFAAPRSGTLKVVVATTGKTVRIEGLGVATG